MKRVSEKNKKARQVRAARGKRVYKKPAVRSTSVQTAGLNLVEKIVEFFDALDKQPEAAKTVRLTKVNEHFEIETRDYSCQCGRPACPNPSVFLTIVFRDGQPVTPPLKSRSLEEVDTVHMRAKRRIEQGLAIEQVEATKDLAHALGSCECHGKGHAKA